MDTTLLQSGNIAAVIDLIRDVCASTMNIALPGEIRSFDPDSQTVVVASCTKRAVILDDGSRVTIERPFVLDVPVVLPYSTTSGFALTHPICKGDQCLIVFSQDALDSWQAYGSVQDPPATALPRHFDYTDAIAIVGLIPAVSAIKNYVEDAIEIRNKEGNSYVRVRDDSSSMHFGTDSMDVTETLNASGRSLDIKSGQNGISVTEQPSGAAQYVFTSGASSVSVSVNSTPGFLGISLASFVMTGIAGESVSLGGGSVIVAAPGKWGVDALGQVSSIQYNIITPEEVLPGITKTMKLKKTESAGGGGVELTFIGGILVGAVDL